MVLSQVNPVAFQFGGLSIRWYALIIVSGIALAVWLAMKEAVRVGMKEDDIIDFILWALPFALIGARAYYVAFEWSYYREHLDQIIAIWQGGIAIYGGLIAGAIVLYFFTRARLLSFWKFLDVAAPSVLIAQAIGRWGNFMNHEAYGPVTTHAFLTKLHLPNFIIQNMYIDGAYRQPTFLYESLWSLLGFICLLVLRSRVKQLKEGEIVFSYVLWYSFGRFFIEGLRTDSLMIGNTIRVSQVLSVVLFVGAAALLIWRRTKTKVPLYDRKELSA